MRGHPFLLTALLVSAALTGCVRQSHSYYINDSDHALTLRADQRYLWQDSVELTLVAARLPDCQRQFVLGEAPIDALAVELYAAGDNLYTLRAGGQAWQIDTSSCSGGPVAEADAPGQPLGSFMLDEEGKMVFEPATPAP